MQYRSWQLAWMRWITGLRDLGGQGKGSIHRSRWRGSREIPADLQGFFEDLGDIARAQGMTQAAPEGGCCPGAEVERQREK